MFLQHPQGFLEEIVEIHRVRVLLFLLVAGVNVSDLLEQRQEIRKLFRQQRINGCLGIDDETKNLSEDVAFREPDFLWIDPGRGDYRVDEVLLILAVHDREPGGIPEGAAMTPQHSIADRMKCSTPKSARVDRQQVRHAIQHLARGFVGESEQQNVSRVDPILE